MATEVIILPPKIICSYDFADAFSGKIILDESVKNKINNWHSVYEADIVDGLGDPYFVVMRSKRKSPPPRDKLDSQGQVYEILCETESHRVLFIIGRLFPSGHLYIITAYWAVEEEGLTELYYRESEVLREYEEDAEKED